MPGSPTPILGLTVPTVDGDSGIWGGELNTDLAILDSLGAVAGVSVSSNYVAVASPALHGTVVNEGSPIVTAVPLREVLDVKINLQIVNVYVGLERTK